MSFETALLHTLKEEGGFVHDKDDPGGATNLGVTQITYDAWRESQGLPRQSVRAITKDEATQLYRSRYWDTSGAAQCDAAGTRLLALCVFDWAVNGGPGRAARYLQHAVGATVDGKIGPKTIKAITECVEVDACAELLRRRAQHYHARCGNVSYQIALRDLGLYPPAIDVNAKKFLRGWLKRLRRLADVCGLEYDPLYHPSAEPR